MPDVRADISLLGVSDRNYEKNNYMGNRICCKYGI